MKIKIFFNNNNNNGYLRSIPCQPKRAQHLDSVSQAGHERLAQDKTEA